MTKLKWLRSLASSSLFWRFRHLLQPDWVTTYGSTIEKSFLDDLIATSKITSVLDFGCAAGSDLERIKNLDNKIAVFGVDINAKAIKSCKSRFRLKFQEGFYFSTKLNRNEIESFIEENKISKIDLVIIDRVFYCFNEGGIDNTLKTLSPYVDRIFIDDFYDDGGTYIGYKHRRWDSIFDRHNYMVETNIETIHKTVEHANARTMVFKKVPA